MGGSLLFLAVAVAAPALKDRPAPPALVGEWEAEASTIVGPASRTVCEFVAPRPRHTFTADGRWLDAAREIGRYAVDRKAPATNLTVTRPDATLSGTFRVDGDVLTLTLSGWPGGRVSTATFRRVKKD
jgi:hypothetical protein